MRIVITGSSSGIGRALAERLLARGHEIWGLARSRQEGNRSGAGGSFRASPCDVADWTQVDAAAREITSVWESIDAIVTCAGAQGEVGRTTSADPLQWSATVRTNLDGTFFAIRALWPLLHATNAGRRAKVVCFSGGGSTKPRPNFSAYGAAKTAVVRLVETIAAEEGGASVDINAVAPGAIRTRMTEEVLALGPEVVGKGEYESALRQPTDDLAPLERALDLVEWLLSPASDGISGRLISAPWDPWSTLDRHADDLAGSDIYTLRRITPDERGCAWTDDANS